MMHESEGLGRPTRGLSSLVLLGLWRLVLAWAAGGASLLRLHSLLLPAGSRPCSGSPGLSAHACLCSQPFPALVVFTCAQVSLRPAQAVGGGACLPGLSQGSTPFWFRSRALPRRTTLSPPRAHAPTPGHAPWCLRVLRADVGRICANVALALA